MMGKKVTTAAQPVLPENAIFLQRPDGPKFPVRLMLMLGLILLGAVFLIIQGHLKEERSRMLEHMKNRADVLIWTLEGSARTLSSPWPGRGDMFAGSSGRQRDNPLSAGRQILLEQAALQPGVEYIAICDQGGKILAHNDPERVGGSLYPPEAMQVWKVLAESSGNYLEQGGKKIFEVVKAFTPRHLPRGVQRRMRPQQNAAHPDGGHGGPEGMAQEESSALHGQRGVQPDAYIFIGLNAAPFEAILARRARSAFITGGGVVFGGISCLALIFLIQNFRASRRYYHNARALGLQVFSNLPLGLLAAGRDGAVLLYNRHAAGMLDLPALGSGGSPDGLVPPSAFFRTLRLEDYPLLDWQGMQARIDSGELIIEQELEIRRSHAAPLPVSLSVSPIRDYQGNAAGYLYILRDLKEVNWLREQAQRGERLSALGNLAAGVAHEIRNPLSALKGYLVWMGEKLCPAGAFTQGQEANPSKIPLEMQAPTCQAPLQGREKRASGKAAEKSLCEAVDLMSGEVERLDRVVGELLGVARAGQLHLEKQNLFEVVQRALRLTQAEADQKQVQLVFGCGSALDEACALIDKDRLLQALLNIMINAVQASPKKGEVRVSLGRSQDADGSGNLLIRVEDDGPGMSSEVQSRLFTPYFTTKADGTGLGLTITHQIVEQHRGRLEVSSMPGRGSRFSIVLPDLG